MFGFFFQSICEPIHATFLILTHNSKSLEKLTAVCCPSIVVKPDSCVLIYQMGWLMMFVNVNFKFPQILVCKASKQSFSINTVAWKSPATWVSGEDEYTLQPVLAKRHLSINIELLFMEISFIIFPVVQTNQHHHPRQYCTVNYLLFKSPLPLLLSTQEMGDSPGLVVFRSNTSCRLWLFTWIIWISVLQLFTFCDTFPFLDKLKRHISFSIAPSRQSICPLFCSIFFSHFFLVLSSVVCCIVCLTFMIWVKLLWQGLCCGGCL